MTMSQCKPIRSRVQTVCRSLAGSLAFALLCGPGGCVSAYEELRSSQEQTISSLQTLISTLNARVHVLEESVPLLACGPEVRALFRDIRKECSASAVVQVEARQGKAPGGPPSCQTNQLTGAI